MDDFKNSGVVQRIKGWILPFVFLFLLLAWLAYITLASLFRPIVWAMLFAFISYPTYQFLLRKLGDHRRTLAASLMTLLVIALVVLPSLAAGYVISREVLGLFGRVNDLMGGFDATKGISLEKLLPETLAQELLPLFSRYPFMKEWVQQATTWGVSNLVRLAHSFLGSSATLLYHQLIIFIVFFFVLRDGHLILKYFGDILPFMSEERQEFIERANVVLRAVVFGVIVTAGVQGLLGALGWWFVGLASPFLAGALMALLAMIPFVGTPTVWGPGAIYLFISGDIKGGLILLLWGLGVVSTVDNFLKPYFISGKAKMSTLLTFLGAFGGLAAWGFLGIFLGPLVLSLFVFFLDSYREAWNAYQEEQRLP
ncbi:MAG: AI-2E family transporter [Fretibacterium sp.]|nr:AI-2E family transporter [Fretibacterium sp.]